MKKVIILLRSIRLNLSDAWMSDLKEGTNFLLQIFILAAFFTVVILFTIIHL